MNVHPHWEDMQDWERQNLMKFIEEAAPSVQTKAAREGGLVIYPGLAGNTAKGIAARRAMIVAIKEASKFGKVPPEYAEYAERALRVIPGNKMRPQGTWQMYDAPRDASPLVLTLLDRIMETTGYGVPIVPAAQKVRRRSSPFHPIYKKDLAGEARLIEHVFEGLPRFHELIENEDLSGLSREFHTQLVGATTLRLQADVPGDLTGPGKPRSVTSYDGRQSIAAKQLTMFGFNGVAMRTRQPFAAARVPNYIIGMESAIREPQMKRDGSCLYDIANIKGPADILRICEKSKGTEIIFADVKHFEANHADQLVRRYCSWHHAAKAMYLMNRAPILCINDYPANHSRYVPGSFSWLGHPTDVTKFPEPYGFGSGLKWTGAFNKRVGPALQAAIALLAGWPESMIEGWLQGKGLPEGYAMLNAGDNMGWITPEGGTKRIADVLESPPEKHGLNYMLEVEESPSFMGYLVQRVSGAWRVIPDAERYLLKAWARERGWKSKDSAGRKGHSARREFYGASPLAQAVFEIEDSVFRNFEIDPAALVAPVDAHVGSELSQAMVSLLTLDPDRVSWDARFDNLTATELQELGFVSISAEDSLRILDKTMTWYRSQNEKNG
jgi:hypothetical protein